jgi:hypothetical protein
MFFWEVEVEEWRRRLVEGFWCLGSVRESKSVVVVGIIGYFA